MHLLTMLCYVNTHYTSDNLMGTSTPKHVAATGDVGKYLIKLTHIKAFYLLRMFKPVLNLYKFQTLRHCYNACS